MCIDIKTWELLTSTGSFNINSDTTRLYSCHNKGGRGHNSFVDIYISRLVSINSHLTEKSPSNTYLALVFNHQKESLVRVVNQFVQCFNIQAEPKKPSKTLSFKIKQKMKEDYMQTWLKTFGYLFWSHEDSNKLSENAIHLWLKKSFFSSHVQRCLPASRKRKSKYLTNEYTNSNCTSCDNQKETIQDIIASYPNLNALIYLPLWHSKITNVIYQNIVPKEEEKCRQHIWKFYSNGQIVLEERR